MHSKGSLRAPATTDMLLHKQKGANNYKSKIKKKAGNYSEAELHMSTG